MILGAKSSIYAGFLTIGVLAGCWSGVDERVARVHSLARHASEANKDRIEELSKDEDRDVRVTALVVMGEIDETRARTMAMASLSDPDGLVRAAAVDLCGETPDAGTVRLLAARVSDDPVWHVRARALRAIASSDEPAVREAFTRALSDPVRQVRRAALKAGSGRPGLLPLDVLSELIATDPDWESRVEAVTALGASLEQAAYVGLDAAVADPNEFVRAAAAREIRALERAGIPR